MISMRFSDMIQLEKYFKDNNLPTYERVGYDRYIKESGFSYNVPTIHLTGTNGKGSTAAFIKDIYAAAGYQTALYTSPYLSVANEMMIINDQPISDSDLLRYMNENVDVFERYHLTTFEMQTIIAMKYFADKKVDLAVIEVGMGGLTDATNVFTPILSVITNVALEHTRFLGNTVEKIAAAKAGIIKSGIPVLLGQLDAAAYATVKAIADKLACQVIKADDATNIVTNGTVSFDSGAFRDVHISMRAPYQAENASVAISAVSFLQPRFPVTEAAMREGLSHTFMPGRFEVMAGEPTIILDGGHNPHAAESIVEAIKTFGHRPVYVVFAAFKDKNVEGVFRQLEEVTDRITVTTFDHIRARRREDYEDLRYPFIADYQDAIRYALSHASKQSIILITGSLAFIGVVRQYLKEARKP